VLLAALDEFRVSDAIFLGEFPGGQGAAAVERGRDGGFVVVWSGAGPNQTYYVDDTHVFAQKIDAAGVRHGDRVTIADADDANSGPDIALDGANGFVVGWTACADSYFFCEYGARILAVHTDAAGRPERDAVAVGDPANFLEVQPVLAATPGGIRATFLATAERPTGPDPLNLDVFSRFLGFNAAPVGELVRASPPSQTGVNNVAAASNGEVTFVVWNADSGTFPADTDVFGRVIRDR
jgi:hypothetical protein